MIIYEKDQWKYIEDKDANVSSYLAIFETKEHDKTCLLDEKDIDYTDNILNLFQDDHGTTLRALAATPFGNAFDQRNQQHQRYKNQIDQGNHHDILFDIGCFEEYLTLE